MVPVKTDYFTAQLAPQNPPTGVYGGQVRDTTEGSTVVMAETTSGGNFWDFVSEVADETKFSELLGQYLGGKIKKEIGDNPAANYTTTGNPSDQPGGALVADLLEQQKIQQEKNQTYLMYGLGAALVVGVAFLALRK